MTDRRPNEVRDAALAQEHLLADPNAPATPAPTVASFLTREMVDAAIASLYERPAPDPLRVQAEMAMVRWLDEQPPGTAGKLLDRMYGGAGDDDE